MQIQDRKAQNLSQNKEVFRMLKLGQKLPSKSWNRGQQTELPSILIAHVRSDGYYFSIYHADNILSDI